MIKYIRKILYIFSSTQQSKEAIEDVHEWLVDNTDYAEEKMSALREIWDNTENVLSSKHMYSYKMINQTINSDGKQKTKKYFLVSWKYAAAIASVLVVLVWSTYLFTQRQRQGDFSESIVEYFCPVADRDSLLLSDGSRVITNSTTLLVYSKDFGKDERIVYLIGEASFSVQNDPKRPFIVKTKHLEVTALGTEFNIKSYPEEHTVYATLIEGSIRVKSNDDDENCILMPGEQLIYNKTKKIVELTSVDLLDVTAWQRGEVLFKGIDVEEILGVLERKYEIKFQYPKGMFNHDKYTFRFKESAPLPEVMDIIQMVVGSFDYNIKGNVCSFSKYKQ